MRYVISIVIVIILIIASYFTYTYLVKKKLIDELILMCKTQNAESGTDTCEITEESRPFLMKQSIATLKGLL